MSITKYEIFFLGVLIGSFLNVCIYRIPRGESIVNPPSHCPACHALLKPWDLIPVVSYMANKGKCRYCRERISLQYPAIEILNGILYILLYAKFGQTSLLIKYAIISSLLLVVAVIDYQLQIIPDSLIIFGLFSGVVFHFVFHTHVSWINGGIGLLMGGGLFFLIALATNGAMGGGDIKMVAMLGFLMGWKEVLLISFLSFVIGAIVSILLIALKKKNRKDYIPFGPFIAIAAYITMLYGIEIMNWYLSYTIG